MTPVYSPIGSAPACPRSYAAEVASLETPLRVGTSCHLQLLHVLAIGVPRKRRSSSGFLKTRRTRLPRSGLVQYLTCRRPDYADVRIMPTSRWMPHSGGGARCDEVGII